MIGHHIAHRLVLNARDVVSPLEQGLQSLELCETLQSLVSPDNHIVVVVLNNGLLIGLEAEGGAFVKNLPQVLVRVLRVSSHTLLNELLIHQIIDVQKVVCIFPRIA